MKKIEAEVTTAHAMAPSGEAVAHVEIDGERRALLVRGGAPDETVRVAFDASERPARAEIIALVRASTARALPACAFVRECGGCDWMHISRAAQREEHLVLAKPVAKSATIAFHEAPRDLGYRTRARLHAREERGKMRIGFFGVRSRDLACVDRCVVLDARIDAARASLASLFSGAHGEGEIALALGRTNAVADVRWSRDLPAAVYARCDEAVRAKRFDGIRILAGESRRAATVGDPTPWIAGADGAPLELAPGGFSQAHEDVNAALAACVAGHVTRARKLIELYAGAGNLTVLLAKADGDARDVRAIESSEPACEAARRNLTTRNLRARVTCADASTFEIPRGTDAVVLDPPRTGAREASTTLAKGPRSVERVVYVSCDRMTLARDAEILSARFRVGRVDLFEMFPHTSHVETVALFEAT